MIKFNNVFFKYKSSKSNVIENINFRITPGSTTVILGKNGVGKSTILKLIMKFNDPIKGNILIKDNDISKMSPLDRSKIIAYVGQDIFNQHDFKVRDYLLFGVTNKLSFFSLPKKEHTDLVLSYAEKFKINHLLDTTMDKISGGEKQIVMICRAFIQGSEIIILDEPLSSLDFSNQNKILNLLKSISNENKTVIFTSHNPNHSLFLDSDVMLINNKQIVASGKARKTLTLELLNDIYDNTVGKSNELDYEEFTIKDT